MSKIEVDQVDPQSGTTLTLGTSGDTVSIPSGVTLANAGTATGFASIAWQSSIVTAATHTASAGQGLWLDTSSNAITLTLPASPSVGDQIIFTDYARKWATNAVTINPNGNNFQGFQTPQPVYDTNGQSVDIVYSGATKGWIPNSDDDVTFETSQSYDVEYLVVAGGGSGGTGDGAGAGAGGYLTNVGGTAIGVTPGQVYTVVVGAGGAGVPGAPKTRGNPGVNSSLSGSGITTVTSIGGGGGGASIGSPNNTGLDGGSGGGAGASGTAGSGTAPQGFDGGANTGGGGGASEAGTDGSSGDRGGGDGLQNAITGSSPYYAGGGGKAPGPGPGGQGGGTSGSTNPNPSSPSPANTGGGSGGANDQSSGNGGSGVVILSMADAKYSGTTSGSPTVATGVSGKTVLTFTGDGSYTA